MSDGNGHPTFVGPGFGTLQRLDVLGANASTPRVVSQRATLRRAMPSIYHDPLGDPSIHSDPEGNRDPFAIRFVGALERVLDPIGAVLDTLPEHFEPDYATRPTIDMLSAWLGVDIDVDIDAATDTDTDEAGEQPGAGHEAAHLAAELEARRKALRMAAELAKSRGTAAGLKLALDLTFPDIPMRIEDGGSVHWSRDGVLAKAEPPSFVVYVEKRVKQDRLMAIARCIDHHKPVEASYRLRIMKDAKAPK
jgi:hypothetical protein